MTEGFGDLTATNRVQLAPGYIEIADNFASIDPTAVGGLGGHHGNPHTVMLKNIGDRGFAHPAILRNDGYTCTDCTALSSLTDQDVVFTVPGWSNYSIGEDNMPPITSCGVTINAPGTYTVSADLTATTGNDCIDIYSNEVILDGAGHTITGDGTQTGIYASAGNNITIEHFSGLNLLGTGLYFYQCTNGLITDIAATSNVYGGVVLDTSSGNLVTNVTASSSTDPDWGKGISFWASTDNTLANITADGNGANALFMDGSSGNTMSAWSIDGSGQDAIILETSSQGNIFDHVAVTNTNAAYRDILFADAGNDGNSLIDTHLAAYNISAGTLIDFKDTGKGEINFTSAISGLGTNLAGDISFATNLAHVDGTKSGLNAAATVSIFNLPTNIVSPEILRDGSTCGGGICTALTSLNAGNVSFTVTDWSQNYSIGGTFPAGHHWIAPTDPTTAALNFTASIYGALISNAAVDVAQSITARDTSGHLKLVLNGKFDVGDVDATTLQIRYNANTTVVELGSTSNLDTGHYLYVPIQPGKSIYVCPHATTIAAVTPMCEDAMLWSPGEARAATTKLGNGYEYIVYVSGTDYIVSDNFATGVGVGSTIQSTIWDSTDAMPYGGQTIYQGDAAYFYANVTNMTGQQVSATCQIDVTPYSTWKSMTWNATKNLYEYNQAMPSSGSIPWKTNCTYAGEDLITTDSITVTAPAGVAVPEFGTVAMILALAVVLGAILVRRQK